MPKKWHEGPMIINTDRCRFCTHSAYSHMEIRGFPNNIEARWDQCDFRNMGCGCPGFGSLDNLKYLEMEMDNE